MQIPASHPCQEFELQSQEGSRLQARRPPRSHCPASEMLFKARLEEALLAAACRLPQPHFWGRAR